MAKCLMIVFKEQYVDFFMENGGLSGMLKYFDEIEKEDLRSFACRHANSQNKGDNLKLPESPVTLHLEDENNKIEHLLHTLARHLFSASSEQSSKAVFILWGKML
ncbi:hypothetical protein CEXT_171271 [Caerostris extrusa]|uniref:Uncharacterized protein n=1 Tax=Caerostris extrusa TaxID=172846 RepID=A0AAV4Y5Y6_CAEEX|nr:hypothetical protein CEXT_171271 [Caerostris extrusa]